MNTQDFDKFLIEEYLKFGSINKVFYSHHFGIPISYAGYDRVLSKYKIVKSAGPNSKLTESLKMLSLVADYKLTLEKIYEKHAPHKLLVSTNTLHRILHYTRLGLTRRQGTALIITTSSDNQKFLMGHDQSLTNNNLGNKGDLTLPMGHSKTGENPKDSIIRVLQHEVFTNQTLSGEFPWHIIPEHPKPIMYVNIADIKVSVYHLEINQKMDFSSFKLQNLKFYDYEQMGEQLTRPGVVDILNAYLGNSEESEEIPVINSSLNLALAEAKKEGVD